LNAHFSRYKIPIRGGGRVEKSTLVRDREFREDRQRIK